MPVWCRHFRCKARKMGNINVCLTSGDNCRPGSVKCPSILDDILYKIVPYKQNRCICAHDLAICWQEWHCKRTDFRSQGPRASPRFPGGMQRRNAAWAVFPWQREGGWGEGVAILILAQCLLVLLAIERAQRWYYLPYTELWPPVFKACGCSEDCKLTASLY